ncbi:MAG: hypothetical protein NTX88_07565 [Candidatus Atribacteria bacterium]|nr:hypothetical protein [Candidatus Atribacteria bacterium]
MSDQTKEELFEFYQRFLSREGLGVYRANPWERCRSLLPEELERLSLPKPQQRRYIHLPLHILTHQEREVIYCLFFDQYSEREAADELHLTRSSVRTYRDRALKKLKEALEGVGVRG